MKRIVLLCALTLVASSTLAATAQASASSTHYRSLPYGKIVKYMRHLSRGVCDAIEECIENRAECGWSRNANGSRRNEVDCLLSYAFLEEVYESTGTLLCSREYIYSLNRSGTLAVRKTPYECQ
jgi:hypothetical protein